MDYKAIVDRLNGHVRQLEHNFPGIWDYYSYYRSASGAKKPFNWPEWCYVPTEIALAFLAKDLTDEEYDSMLDSLELLAPGITALAAWRATKGIYCFDKDIVEAILSSPMSDKLPVQLFYRLPQWCMYITLQEEWKIDVSFKSRLQTAEATYVYGFFVYLDYNKEKDTHYIWIVLDTSQDVLPLLPLRGIEISNSITLGEILNAAVESVEARHVFTKWEITNVQFIETYKEQLQKCIALILYLCADNREIINPRNLDAQPDRPTLKKVKGKFRMFVPSMPTQWQVGYRLGSALRKARQNYQQNHTNGDSSRAMPPHVRNAHWHHYWTGRRQEKSPGTNLVLKWILPTWVNMEPGDEVTPVIRPVVK